MTDRSFAAARKAIQESSPETSIYIGCDSQRYSRGGGKFDARYSAVIVVHKDSNRGGRIFHESKIEPDYGRKTEGLAVRLMKEAEFAIQALEAIIDVVEDRHVEIHLDINTEPEHASQAALQQALGYVKGMTGYDALAKPDAWAATHAADHAVRNMKASNERRVN